MLFERFVCQPVKSTKVEVKDCSMRRIGRIGADRINSTVNFLILEPITEFHIQITFFFKYQSYRKLPIDISDDLCNLFKGKKRNKFIDQYVRHALKFFEFDQKLECPLEKGMLSIKMNNISLNDEFPMGAMLPSGQYRVNVVLSEGHRETIFLMLQFYMEISDKRVQQYDNFDDIKFFVE